MKKARPIIDDKNYTVVGINGYRQGSLTRKQAILLARRMQDLMDRVGWRGEMRIFYRDGSLVKKEDWEDYQENSND